MTHPVDIKWRDLETGESGEIHFDLSTEEYALYFGGTSSPVARLDVHGQLIEVKENVSNSD